MTEPQEATVVATVDLSPDIRQIELAPHGKGVRFEPGGHVDILVPLGDGEQRRSYSHVGLGPQRTLLIAVKLMPDSRGGSKYMWSLEKGDRIRIEAARNNFPLSFAAPTYRLLAGGIGITPIIGMARALKAAGKDFSLRYCVRTAYDGAFVSVLEQEFGDSFDLHDDAELGRLDAERFVADTPMDAELYMCGPLPMMNAVKRAWFAKGREPAKLRFETFGSTGLAGSGEFAVTVLETGERVTVRRDETLLEALVAAGLPILFDCKLGECGLCKVHIRELEGEIDHRDVFLSEAERKTDAAMCACVSRLVEGHALINVDSISHGRAG